MLKTLAKLEQKIGEKTYQFLLDADSSLEHTKQALYAFLGYVTEVEKKVVEQHSKAAEEAKQMAPVEETKTEALPEQPQG